MQIVIDVPEEIYKWVNDVNKFYIEYGLSDFIDLVKNGTPLPKGHGRLIDADELYGDFIDGTEGYDCQTWNRIEIGDVIENAPTIVEAEGE